MSPNSSEGPSAAALTIMQNRLEGRQQQVFLNPIRALLPVKIRKCDVP